MGHKVREAMGQRIARYRLTGLVEMDETFFVPKSRVGSNYCFYFYFERTFWILESQY